MSDHARRRIRYAKYDGKWLVRAVGHKADNQSFQTILFLTRPDPDELPADGLDSYKPFWEEEVPHVAAVPHASFIEEQWVSSWS